MNLSQDDLAQLDDWLRRRGPDCLGGRVLEDGADFGPFQVLGLLGRGGSAEVCRAVERESGAVVALKVPHRGDRAGAERFRREARLLSEHPHPALPRLVASGEEDGIPWLALEELRPGDLPASPRAVTRFLLALCEGLAHLHSLGLVHRDVKPENILYRAGGQPVLIDLGLVKDAAGPAPFPERAPLSVVGSRAVGFGTPGYAAPEQFTAGEVSPAADVYALGMLALRCFGGRPPLCWRSVLRRATAPLPADRYPAAAAFARALRRRRLPAFAATAAVAVLALAGFAAWFPSSATETPAPQPIAPATPASRPASPDATPAPASEPRPVSPAVTSAPRPEAPAATEGETPAPRPEGNLPPSSSVLYPATALAERLGLPSGGWLTSSDYPWEADPDDPSGIRSGISGGVGASVLSIPVEGPARVSFRYFRHFPGKKLLGDRDSRPSAFFVLDGKTALLFDPEGDKNYTDQRGEPCDASFDLPAGHHRLRFVYRHGGTGYIDHFNGVRLRDLKIERMDTASDDPHPAT